MLCVNMDGFEPVAIITLQSLVQTAGILDTAKRHGLGDLTDLGSSPDWPCPDSAIFGKLLNFSEFRFPRL